MIQRPDYAEAVRIRNDYMEKQENNVPISTPVYKCDKDLITYFFF